jgi:hypothetical protein
MQVRLPAMVLSVAVSRKKVPAPHASFDLQVLPSSLYLLAGHAVHLSVTFFQQ